MTTRALILLLAALLLGAPSTALADAISGPPEDCPRGSEGTSSHAGEWCRPTTCTDDAACREDHRCQEALGLCVGQEERWYGRWGGPEDQNTYMTDVVYGACSSDADCGQGSCVVARRCAPSLSRVIQRKADGCFGCSTVGAPVGVGLAGLLLLGLLTLRRRGRGARGDASG
jgi:hypothetical protein